MAIFRHTKRIDAKHYEVKSTDYCRNCVGEGLINGEQRDTCPVCEGWGKVVITKDIRVSIAPAATNNL
jgi:DnaJ-class molecular chaperone